MEHFTSFNMQDLLNIWPDASQLRLLLLDYSFQILWILLHLDCSVKLKKPTAIPPHRCSTSLYIPNDSHLETHLYIQHSTMVNIW